MHLGPHILIACFKMGAGCRQCLAVVAHAPIEAAASEVKNAFWKDVEDAVDRHLIKSPNAEVFGMIDANARVGECVDQAVGPEGAQAENDNGSRFHSFLSTFALAACNTWLERSGGSTWKGGRGGEARIDYTFVRQSAMRRVLAAGAVNDKEIDLSTADKIDHYAVFCDIEVDVRGEETGEDGTSRVKKASAVKFDPKSTKDPAKREAFQAKLREAHIKLNNEIASNMKYDKSPLALDSRVQAWAKMAREAAEQVFANPAARPVKPWMSEDTWRMVRKIAPVRRRAWTATMAQRTLDMKVVLACWKLTLSKVEHTRWTEGTPANEQARKIPGLLAAAKQYDKEIAMNQVLMRRARTASRAQLRADKAEYLENRAKEAQEAADKGDTKTTYQIIRILAGVGAKPHEMVKSAEGERLTDPDKIHERWVEHFAGVFAAGAITEDEEAGPIC